jgi:hypothetical protein
MSEIQPTTCWFIVRHILPQTSESVLGHVVSESSKKIKFTSGKRIINKTGNVRII